jgi:hypothetical protein
LDGVPFSGFGDVNGIVDLVDYLAPDSTSFHTATWTAVDECMNLTQVSQNLVVLSAEDISDSAVHFIAIPDSLEIDCADQWPQSLPMAYSACEWIEVQSSDSSLVDFCLGGIQNRLFIAFGLDSVEYFATQILLVQPDILAPEYISTPGDMTRPCDFELPEPIDMWAEDNCDELLLGEVSDEYFDNGCIVYIDRMTYVADGCGNVAEHSQVFTLVDDEAPYLISDFPPDTTLVCGIGDIPSPPQLEFEDDCQSDIDIEYVEIGEGQSCDSVITRTWIVSDGCGNELLVTQVIDFEGQASSVSEFDLNQGLELIFGGQDITIQITSELEGQEVEYTIYDTMGHRVLSLMNASHIDLSNLSVGVYTIQALVGQKVKTESFIKR